MRRVPGEETVVSVEGKCIFSGAGLSVVVVREARVWVMLGASLGILGGGVVGFFEGGIRWVGLKTMTMISSQKGYDMWKLLGGRLTINGRSNQLC